jgi:hypothetical protein
MHSDLCKIDNITRRSHPEGNSGLTAVSDLTHLEISLGSMVPTVDKILTSKVTHTAMVTQVEAELKRCKSIPINMLGRACPPETTSSGLSTITCQPGSSNNQKVDAHVKSCINI